VTMPMKTIEKKVVSFGEFEALCVASVEIIS
jgi:hypothetical protein